MGANVHTEGCFVDRDQFFTVNQRISLPPFYTTTNSNAVADGVEEVLVDTNVIFTRISDTKVIALENVIEVVS